MRVRIAKKKVVRQKQISLQTQNHQSPTLVQGQLTYKGQSAEVNMAHWLASHTHSDRFTAGLLLDSRPQMRYLSVSERGLMQTKDVKIGEYEQGR
jgi:hypothetical protein